jgi:hypothetical protein
MWIILILSLIILGVASISTLLIDDVKIITRLKTDVIPGSFAVGIGITLMFYLGTTSEVEELEIKLNKLRFDRQEITKKIEDEKNLDIFHTIQLSLNQLDEYYTINKSQATTSFRFSLFAIVLGLITLLIGVWMNYYGSKNIPLTFLAGASTLLLEFIGGAYFFMYKKSLEQVNFFFGQLIRVQDTMLAINLVNGVNDDSKKTDMTEKIIVSLLERSLK